MDNQSLDCQQVRRCPDGGIPYKLLRTVACRKKFVEHPDTPALTLRRHRMVCFSATVQRN